MAFDVEFRVSDSPVAQPRGRCGRNHNIYIPSSHAVHRWKEAVQLAARQAYQGKPLEGRPLAIWLMFVMPRPGRAPKREPQRQWNLGSRLGKDWDNLAKSTQDALEGILLVDGAAICWAAVQKLTAALGEDPHAMIRIQELHAPPRN